MILMAFFDSQPHLQDSDEERINFAQFYLKNLRFLYKDSQDEDKKVTDPKCDPTWCHLTTTLIRNGRGSFGAPSSSRRSLFTLVR